MSEMAREYLDATAEQSAETALSPLRQTPSPSHQLGSPWHPGSVSHPSAPHTMKPAMRVIREFFDSNDHKGPAAAFYLRGAVKRAMLTADMRTEFFGGKWLRDPVDEDAIENAYWELDSRLKSNPGGDERLAFKEVLRGQLRRQRMKQILDGRLVLRAMDGRNSSQALLHLREALHHYCVNRRMYLAVGSEALKQITADADWQLCIRPEPDVGNVILGMVGWLTYQGVGVQIITDSYMSPTSRVGAEWVLDPWAVELMEVQDGSRE